MKRIVRATTAAVLAALLIACGGGEEAGPEPAEEAPAEVADTARPGTAPGPGETAVEPVSGEAVFNANCATCHGEDGQGGGPAAVGLEPPPADFTDGRWVTGDGSLEAIRNTIENGSPGTAMIAWKGTLTDAQIDAVARYVKGLGSGGAQ